jgi:CRP-like cAMP-binding protein
MPDPARPAGDAATGAQGPPASLDLADLARRLGATTMFSPLSRDQLTALLRRSPYRRAPAGASIGTDPAGLCDHLVLLQGEVETEHRWTAADGAAGAYVRRVGVPAGPPGFALVGAGERRLHVRAVSDTTYLAIDADELDDLLGWTHLGGWVLPEPHLKIFHRLPLENVSLAIGRLVELAVAAGETVVREGEPGETYFVIVSGQAQVFQADDDGEPRLLNQLNEGDAFGEEALLADGRRTATVRMTTPGTLLALSREDFDALLRPPLVAEVSPSQARAMLARGEAGAVDCRSAAEFAQGRLPAAQHVPLDDLRREAVFALDPDHTHVVYCRNGRRSRAAAFLLQERGIRALSLQGGLAGWPFEVDRTTRG